MRHISEREKGELQVPDPNIRKTHPLKATMQRLPDVGNFRNAKSLEGSHISVSVLGRYPPMLPAIPLVRPSDLRLREDLRQKLDQ